MTMNQKRLAALLLTTALAARPALAAFQQSFASPQAAALGNAALANTADSSALLTNPAATAGIRGRDVYFMYNQLYAGAKGMGGLDDGYMTAATGSKLGVFSVGVATFRAQNLKLERTIALGWAKTSGRWAFGAAAKHLYHNYLIDNDPTAPGDPVFRNGTARSAFGVDFGATYHATSALSFGAVVRNLNSPDVGLDTEDRVPRELQAAAAYDFKRHGLRVTADVAYRDAEWGQTQDRLTPGVGLEKWVSDGRAAFRVGATTLGASAGVGLNLGRIGFDYTFAIKRHLADAGYGTHMVGLRVKFGGR